MEDGGREADVRPLTRAGMDGAEAEEAEGSYAGVCCQGHLATQASFKAVAPGERLHWTPERKRQSCWARG